MKATTTIIGREIDRGFIGEGWPDVEGDGGTGCVEGWGGL